MSQDTFTRQCDCPEIQDGWEPKVGDKYAARSCVDITGFVLPELIPCRLHSDMIYLPSETDLWAKLPVWAGLIKTQVPEKGKAVIRYRCMNTSIYGGTAQQALIQGVMYELHQKKWDNEKGWVR